jgi:hypothetical protein
MDYGTYDGVDYGTVDYKNKTLTIMQAPYPDNHPYDSDLSVYKAIAHSEDGYEFEVTWSIKDYETDDESDACDWEEFSVRELGEIK